MSNAALGLTMLGLIVVVIMMGFPTAFTLMGLGMMFGFVAFYDPTQSFLDNKIFDLMVQRAFGAMNNDTLVHPAVCVDGLCDGAWRAGGQNVP